MIKLVSLLALGLMLVLAGTALSQTGEGPRPGVGADPVVVHLFWSETCPHCTKAKAFLDALAAGDAGIILSAREVSADTASEMAFIAVSRHFQVEPLAVPLVAVGERVFVGYRDHETTGAQIVDAIETCRRQACADPAADVIARTETGSSPGTPAAGTGAARQVLPDTLRLPVIGDVELRSLSLPVLTLVLAAVDGFNPCAMWALVLLIGLLLGMRDSLRMWSYGAVFLLTSAAVYFAVLAAWLNVFLVVGSIALIRAGVGVLAVIGGGYYLWQFAANPAAVCEVTSPEERQSIMGRLRRATTERSFLLAVAGIAALAVAVNLIELLCSAGIPALFTQVLALSDLPAPAYYGYLLAYVGVFLLDDAIVFITAMVTLRASALSAVYARYSHLVGGVVLGAIGLMLLFRPGWLAFA